MGKIKVKFCPKCGSEEVQMVIGGQMGLWECKKCRYRGSIFPEKELTFEKIKTKEKRKKK